MILLALMIFELSFAVNKKVPCNSNLAMCNLKLKEYKQCIHFATKVIDIDPGNIKAIYRRGMSHLACNDVNEEMDIYAQEIDNKRYVSSSYF